MTMMTMTQIGQSLCVPAFIPQYSIISSFPSSGESSGYTISAPCCNWSSHKQITGVL